MAHTLRPAGEGRYAFGNVERFYGSTSLSQADKEQRVNSVMINNDQLLRELYNPDEINFRTLTFFLRLPEYCRLSLDSLANTGERQQMKWEVARRLFPAVNFIQGLAENSVTKQILEKEFGFGKLLQPEHLEEVNNEMNKFLDEVLPDELPDAKGPAQDLQGVEAIPEEDERVIGEIAKAVTQERHTFTHQKTAEVHTIVGTMAQEVQTQQQGLAHRREQLQPHYARVKELEARQGKIERELAEAQARQVAGRFGQMFGKGISESDKASLVANAQRQLTEVQNALTAHRTQIAQIGEVDTNDVLALEGKLARLQNLQRAA